jgi:hypothetical protein
MKLRNCLLFTAIIAFTGCKKKESTSGGDPSTKPATEETKPAESTTTTTDDCRKVQAHIFEITPESAEALALMAPAERQKIADGFAAAVEDKDIKNCLTYPKATVACMQAAPTLATLKACMAK